MEELVLKRENLSDSAATEFATFLVHMDMIRKKDVPVVCCPTKEMVADHCNKPNRKLVSPAVSGDQRDRLGADGVHPPVHRNMLYNL